MDSIFSRKKARPRQGSLSSQDLNERSVPYDKLGPSPRSPIPVNTISQGLRGTPSISAPITNPTLTTDGAESIPFSISRQAADRERPYPSTSEDRHQLNSPNGSVSTMESSTLYSDSMASFSSTNRPKTP